MKQKDYCTWFPEKWIAWQMPPSLKEFYKIIKKVYIGGCCKGHDDTCSTRNFIDCLWRLRIVGATIITIGGFIGCVFKLPKLMYNRLKNRFK